MKLIGKPIKLKATVMWSFHNKINSLAKRYTIDFCNLSPGAVKSLEGMGVKVLKRENKPEKGFYITCKSTEELKVFDTNGDSLSNTPIGNGSTAIAVVGAYEWTYENRKGISPTLVSCVIEDLVSYSADSAGTQEEEEEVL